MSKVYVVQQGGWDDQEIVAVFTSKRKMEYFMDRFEEGHFQVMEYEANKTPFGKIKRGDRLYYVCLPETGVGKASLHGGNVFRPEDLPTINQQDGWMVVTLWASSPEQAHDEAVALREKLKAKGLWLAEGRFANTTSRVFGAVEDLLRKEIAENMKAIFI